MLTGRIWQAIAQSGVDLSPVPRDQQDRLVGTIAESMLIGVNELLDQVAPTAAPGAPNVAEDLAAEQILWEGRPFLSLTERYIVTSERIRIQRGLVAKDYEDIELVRLQDIDRSQSVGERMMNIGDITLRSVDVSRPQVMLRNVADPEQVHEIIRRAWLEARKRHGVQFRDQM
jgi:hypothetical protein